MAATIVMPVATPTIKHANVSALGAKVVLSGDDFDASKLECARLVKEHGVIDIPPYDDPYVIAGQGTIAMEILRQTNVAELDGIFVCVGGGGLLAGMAAYIRRIAPPHVKIIGVEARDQTAMTTSLLSGKRETLPEVGLFCDGTAVRIVGEETYRLCNELVDAMVLVSNDEVCAAIKDVFQGPQLLSFPRATSHSPADTRSVPEPSGALAVAGLKRYVTSQGLIGSGKRFVALASGANMNFDRLRFVAERAALGEGKEALLSVIIPEKPGSSVPSSRPRTRISLKRLPRQLCPPAFLHPPPRRDRVLLPLLVPLPRLHLRLLPAALCHVPAGQTSRAAERRRRHPRRSGRDAADGHLGQRDGQEPRPLPRRRSVPPPSALCPIPWLTLRVTFKDGKTSRTRDSSRLRFRNGPARSESSWSG